MVGAAVGDAVGAGVLAAGAEPPPLLFDELLELLELGDGLAVGIAEPVTSMLTLTVLVELGRSASVITARRKVIELGDGVLKDCEFDRSDEVRTFAFAGTTSMRSS